MSSNNLRLPTTGATNWGSGLNAYIRHLEERISVLESISGDNDLTNVIQNIAGACSGIVSNFNCTMTDRIVVFSGKVYFSGSIRKQITIEDANPITSDSALPLSDTNNSYFIYLKYEGTSDDDLENLTIISEKELSLNYSKILLGFYYNNIFVPYYYWDLKTIMQHQYELANPYALIDELGVNINVTAGQVKQSTGGAGVTMGPTEFQVRCGGLGWANDQANVNIHVSPEILPLDVDIKNTKNYFLVDSVGTDHMISTSFSGESIPSANAASNIYRILLDVFGNIFIQKASDNLSGFDISNRNISQTLLNTRFGRKFYAKNTDDEYTYSLQANLFMEIGRFGFAGSNTTGSYSIGLGDTYSASINNIAYVRSLKDGVANQPYQNMWVTEDSHLYLDKIKFSNDSADAEDNYFSFQHNTLSDTTKTINLTAEELSNQDLWAHYDIDSFSISSSWKTFSTIIFSANVDSIKITNHDNSEIEFAKNSNTTEELYADDGGNFTCTSTTDSENRLVLEFTNTSGFTPTDDEKTKLASIKLKEIEIGKVTIHLDELYSVKGEPTVLWLNTNAKTENLLLKNNYGSLSINQNGFSDLVGQDGLRLFSDSKEILMDAKNTRTILQLYANPKLSTYSGGGWELVDNGYRSRVKIQVENNNAQSLHYWSDFTVKSYYPASETNESYKEFFKYALHISDTGTILDDTLVLNAETISSKGNILMDEGKEILFTSDRRRKEGFKNLDIDYLPIVCNVPVLNYRYKNSDKQQVGIIAQDLEQHMTKNIDCFVSIEDTNELKDKRSLNETKLVYILWKALQEEVQERKKLEQRLKSLEG